MSDSYPSWLPKRPPPPVPASTYQSSADPHPRAEDIFAAQGRKPTPRSIRIVAGGVPWREPTGDSAETRVPSQPRRVSRTLPPPPPPRPRFRAPSLHLSLLRSPALSMRIRYMLHPLFVFGHLLVQTYFDFNIVFILVQCVSPPLRAPFRSPRTEFRPVPAKTTLPEIGLWQSQRILPVMPFSSSVSLFYTSSYIASGGVGALVSTALAVSGFIPCLCSPTYTLAHGCRLSSTAVSMPGQGAGCYVLVSECDWPAGHDIVPLMSMGSLQYCSAGRHCWLYLIRTWWDMCCVQVAGTFDPAMPNRSTSGHVMSSR